MAASPLLLSSSRKPCLNAARSSPASAHARPPGVRGAGLRRERFYSCTAILPQSHANATHKNNTSVGAEAATAEAASFQHFCPWYCNTPEGGCKADPRRPAVLPCCRAAPRVLNASLSGKMRLPRRRGWEAATSSSKVILKAIENALSKGQTQSSSSLWGGAHAG